MCVGGNHEYKSTTPTMIVIINRVMINQVLNDELLYARY